MFCPSCGKPNAEEAPACTSCNTALPTIVKQASDPFKGLEHVLPVKTSLWAIAAGYLGLFFIFGVTGPPAFACGVIALASLRRNPGLRGHVRAWVGIVLGLLGTFLLYLFLQSMLNP